MKISYSQVENYCNELHNIANKMNTILENINSIGKQVNGSWSGEAANYYINKINTLSGNFDDIFREIENCILFMAKCSDGYKAIDEHVMQEICNNLHINTPNLNTSSIFS